MAFGARSSINVNAPDLLSFIDGHDRSIRDFQPMLVCCGFRGKEHHVRHIWTLCFGVGCDDFSDGSA